ncbi:hypothetical protein G3A_05130 [Bacillus sp. 17376]|uniref:Uncharacterized protein n=1 Tax=Mesobacillus boroniphilus JCM 21738 TaxID=1294265 RepID=W4RU17_9BACI|nr:hypothetical protein [Mesobacillus boroniphilus]ESU33586.1 hypothetical protein G3A_05130 [Bacillus sp. 17376]GAE47806.1 hypothetical protein JCM21738_4825 [Mesobacillus boroniphilus JCM 21738]
MDNQSSKDMVEQMRKMNEQLMDNLMRQREQKRNYKKLQDNLNNSQGKMRDELKKQFSSENLQPNSSLSDMLDKLLNNK